MSSTTKRLLITSLITVLVAGGLFGMAHQLNVQSTNLRTALETIANQAAVDRAFSSLVSLLESTAVEREQIDTYVIDGEQGTISFLSQIEALAEQHGVTVSGTTLNTSTHPVFNIPVLEVAFAFSGPAATTETYLLALEQLPYASYIATLSMSASNNIDGAATELRGQLGITAAIKNIEL